MIKRYSFWIEQQGIESDDGDWCKYSEVKELEEKVKYLENALMEVEMGESL